MKKLKTIVLAIWVSGIILLPQGIVIAEELTSDVAEVLTSDENVMTGNIISSGVNQNVWVPNVGTNIIAAPKDVQINDISVSPETGTLMREGDIYTLSFVLSGTTVLPETVSIYGKADYYNDKYPQ